MLTLCLTVWDFLVSAMLIREKEKIQKLVYLCSKSLRGIEERYPKMEKLVLALITATRRLRPYFPGQTIKIPINQPMEQVFHKPESSGRLVKWANELGEFDIKFKPRVSIKGQALGNFIAE